MINIEKKSIAIMESRKNFYSFLASFFRKEVSIDFILRLKDTNFPSNSKNAKLNEGYKLIKEYLEDYEIEMHDYLDADFAKIFLGAGINKGDYAFPYESVYTSQRKILMQEATDEVKYIYYKKGIQKSTSNEISEDHISLELEFMSYLCNEAANFAENEETEKFKNSLVEQKSFLDEHILNWVNDFCNDIEKFAETKFYLGISKITRGYLESEEKLLKNLI